MCKTQVCVCVCMHAYSFFLLLLSHPLLIMWMKWYLGLKIFNSYICWQLMVFYMMSQLKYWVFYLLKLSRLLVGVKKHRRNCYIDFRVFYIDTLYPVHGSAWNSSKEQKMFSDFEISLEWVSDFAGQMNCCYFCDCAEGISSTQAIQQQLLFASSNKSIKSISLSLCLAVVFLTFRDEVLVKLIEASFTFVFLKRQVFCLVSLWWSL